MKFRRIEYYYEANEIGIVYLIYNHWDDYSYCTTFTAYYKCDKLKDAVELGTVKIGCISLESRVESAKSINGYSSYSIKKLIPNEVFDKLPDDFFSLGQDIGYYKKVNSFFEDENTEYYDSMQDLAYNYNRFQNLYDEAESCLRNSLMRNLYVSNVEQFNRITKGQAELTEYSFDFRYNEERIDINVIPNSLPPSNIHILIGRNGVGKTWLLHNIACKLLENSGVSTTELEKSKKYSISDKFFIDCPQNSFAGIIGLSFSVFDDALSIDILNPKDKEQILIDEFRKKYKYIGSISKSQKDGKTKIKSVEDLANEFLEALSKISKSKNKVETYLDTCRNLNTDPMFYDNGFITILESYFGNKKKDITNALGVDEKGINVKKVDEQVGKYFKRLSSGHMIIILSLTLLAESIHEKTIVLIDEPETHLHPPLLSTYIRTLSFLLLKKNAVAIIATHSPIVLQEVPKDCVNRIVRTGENMEFDRISLESFATNTDSLTREVFGFELVKTGFYRLIEKELDNTFDESIKKFDGKVGFLGQILMQSLLNKKRETYEKNK
ncbi:AAA family ATPase [Clostridium niameyense]|uniref:AAA family ATPase n=1 Tax=Clostridium niameyense TaxID=1622073 RepID=UPI00067F3E97|nr:AAA family ATPase [Clostridium niameyense]